MARYNYNRPQGQAQGSAEVIPADGYINLRSVVGVEGEATLSLKGSSPVIRLYADDELHAALIQAAMEAERNGEVFTVTLKAEVRLNKPTGSKIPTGFKLR